MVESVLVMLSPAFCNTETVVIYIPLPPDQEALPLQRNCNVSRQLLSWIDMQTRPELTQSLK